MSPSFESDEILSIDKITCPNAKTSRGVYESSGGFTFKIFRWLVFMANSRSTGLCAKFAGILNCLRIEGRIGLLERDV